MSILMAVLIGVSAMVQSADNPRPPQVSRGTPVTVSGCVAQPPRTGSLAGEPSGATPATPNTAGVEANSNEPVKTFVLLDAVPVTKGSGTSSRGARTSYGLQGHEADLATHRGHRVEIVGYLLPSPPEAASTNAKAPPRLEVTSIKMLNPQCSAEGVPRR